MATLIEILTGHVEYGSSWAVYAEALEPDSPARMGQTQFENGGLLDSKRYVIDGLTLGDAKLRYFEDNYAEADREQAEGDFGPAYPEFLDYLIDEGYIDWSEEAEEAEEEEDDLELAPSDIAFGLLESATERGVDFYANITVSLQGDWYLIAIDNGGEEPVVTETKDQDEAIATIIPYL